MNYPVWYLPTIGGGLLIALVAIVHVVVSHFAVGGGLWLVLTEKKAYRDKKDFILDYVKRHTRFFMLLTMVLGAMTGVGIWLTISLVSPDATSFLIHTFVFVWAIEWVFFLIEIVTAFLYFYTFQKISPKIHLLIGWIYFLAAWASLFTINGILSFMLTPGEWLETQNFWQGFFNPTFLPSTFFRTFLSFALAGSYALLTAAKKFSGKEKSYLVRYNAKWIWWSVLGMIPSLIWYYFSSPELTRRGLTGLSFIMTHSFYLLAISMVFFLILLFLVVMWRSEKFNFSWAAVVLLSIFVFFGAFEFIRESGRKPFIIGDFMYPSGLKVSEEKEMKNKSILKYSKWVTVKDINKDNELKAGEAIFRLECYACHTLGFKNNFVPTMNKWSERRIVNMIGKLKGITPFMTAFVGSQREKEALGKWLYFISRQGTESSQEVLPLVFIKGETIFENFCSDCHQKKGRDGIKNLMTSYQNSQEIFAILGKLEELSDDMPPFDGTEEERKALAEYLFKLKGTEKKDE